MFLVHGEATSMQALAESLITAGYTVTIPEKGITYDLN
ncbi:MAG: MBL fold metallo-hydrolase RNA specificity domain-containing protein [Mucilaginibacter sp.]